MDLHACQIDWVTAAVSKIPDLQYLLGVGFAPCAHDGFGMAVAVAPAL
jgi:hypothetical protein